MNAELFKASDKRLRRRGIVHGWLKPFLFAAALTFLAVLASHGAEETPRKADYVDPVTGMEFVLVKGGEFEIVRGPCTDDTVFAFQRRPRPTDVRLLVRVSDFYIGKYEVTQAQWAKVMGKNESYFQGEDRPVDCVSWDESQEFMQKLNALTKGKFRLPTGTEWEFAARSGGGRYEWSGTSVESEVEEFAWIDNDADKIEGPRLHYRGQFSRYSKPVGGKKSNRLGLYDMTGNVMEWVLDGSLSTLAGEEKLPGWTSDVILDPHFGYMGDYRVLKGGSFFRPQAVAKNHLEHVINRELGLDDFGLRVAFPASGDK